MVAPVMHDWKNKAMNRAMRAVECLWKFYRTEIVRPVYAGLHNGSLSDASVATGLAAVQINCRSIDLAIACLIRAHVVILSASLASASLWLRFRAEPWLPCDICHSLSFVPPSSLDLDACCHSSRRSFSCSTAYTTYDIEPSSLCLSPITKNLSTP